MGEQGRIGPTAPLRPLGRFLICLAAFVLLSMRGALAFETTTLSGGSEEYPLGRHVSYLEDVAGSLTLRDVLSGSFDQAFVPTRGTSPNLGFTGSTYWFRVDLLNLDSPVGDWLLELQYPLLDYVDVHLVYPDAVTPIVSYRSGDKLPFSERQIKHRNMLFKLPLKAGEKVAALIRVRTDSSMQLPLTLWSGHALLERDQKEQLVLGTYYGILVAMLLFNLMIYLSIRDINYLYYVAYLGSMVLFQSSLNGLAFQYFWPDSPRWGNIATPFFIGLLYSAIILFSREFLQLKKNLPSMDKSLRAFQWLFLAVMMVSLILNYTIAIKMATFFTMLATVLVFVSGALSLKRGVLHAKYFMLAWSVLLLFIFVYTLKTFGILPRVFITEYGLQIGAALETILLSYALAHRLRLLRIENETIQRGITETLEHRVRERTAELDTALSHLAEANRKLTDLNHTDGLTGVKNRNYFVEVLRREWLRCRRTSDPVSLLLLDIDHFKQINDTYGHLAGDVCLKQVAQAVSGAVQRPADQVFRLGGEEFVVLLPATNTEGALHVAERIRGAVSVLSIKFGESTMRATVSVGVCTAVPDAQSDEESLIRNADYAMYEAKHAGRNRTCIFSGASLVQPG